MKIKLKNTNKEKILIFIILFTILLLIFLTSAQESAFKQNDVATWPEDREQFKTLSSNEKETFWTEASGFIRNFVVDQIAQDIRTDLIKRTEQLNKIKELTGLTPEGLPPQLKIKGFESQNLYWEENLIITDGNIKLDLEKIPIDTKEIEYKNGKLIYTFKDGNKITISKGSIDENYNYVNPEQNIGLEETQRNIKLFPGETGTIEVNDKAEFKLSGDAKVQIGDRTFQAKEGKTATLSIEDSSHFKASNTKITTPSLNIETPETPTDIILKQGDYSDLEQYVQIYQRAEVGMDGPEQELKYVNIKGKDITLELKEDVQAIGTKGQDIIVKDSNGEIIIDNERTYTNRKSQEQLQTNTNIENTNQESGNNDVSVKVEDESKSKIEAGSDSEKKFCIGKFCTIGGLGWSGFYTEEKPFGIKIGTLQQLVSENYVYASESQVNEFIEKAKRESWNRNQVETQAINFFDNIESVTHIKKTDLTWKDIEPGLEETIISLGLSSTEKAKVTEFQRNVFKVLGGDKTGTKTSIPGETKIITLSSGKKYGIISFQFPNGRIMEHKITGSYFDTQRRKNMKENSYKLSEVLKRF